MPEFVLPASSVSPRLRMPGLSSDARLAQLAASGDRRAFAEIFARHHQAIYRYCRSILRNDEDAADALQNTMAAALRGLEGETREIALKAWLFRIAHNESLSLMRQRTPQASVDEVDVPVRSGLEAEVLASERLHELVEDVQALPDRQRGALLMRELSGLEYAEIAAVFGVAEGAARQAVYEAREMLRELGEGRAMACADIRELISALDGRLLRGRKVRAHLRACAGCREFRAMIPARSARLAALAPPLAAPLVASMLQGLLHGAGHGGAGVPMTGTSMTAAASVTTGKSVTAAALTAKATAAAGMVTKAAVVLAAGAVLTGGAVAVEQQLTPAPGRPTPSSRAADTPHRGPVGTNRLTTGAHMRVKQSNEGTGVDLGTASGRDRTRPDLGSASGRDRAKTRSTPHPGGSAQSLSQRKRKRGMVAPQARRPASRRPAADRRSSSTRRPAAPTPGARRPAQPRANRPTSGAQPPATEHPTSQKPADAGAPATHPVPAARSPAAPAAPAKPPPKAGAGNAVSPATPQNAPSGSSRR